MCIRDSFSTPLRVNHLASSTALGFLDLPTISNAASKTTKASCGFSPPPRIPDQVGFIFAPDSISGERDFVATDVCRMYTIPKYRPRSSRLKRGSPVASVKSSTDPAGAPAELRGDTALKSETEFFLSFQGSTSTRFFVSQEDSQNDKVNHTISKSASKPTKAS